MAVTQLLKRGVRSVLVAERVLHESDPQQAEIGKVLTLRQFKRLGSVALHQASGAHEAMHQSGLRIESSAAVSATIAACYFGGFVSIAMDANQAAKSAISASVSGLAMTLMVSSERLPLR